MKSISQSTNLKKNNNQSLTLEEERTLKILEKYKSDNPYLFFVPNIKTEQFIKNVGNMIEDRWIHMFIGGNGSGKSCCLANVVCNIVCDKKNPYFDFGIFKNWPFLRRLRIVSDPTTISEKTVPELIKWLPKGKYKASKEKKSYFSKFYFPDTDFLLDILSYDQDPKEFESVDLGACFLDEPPPENIFNACLSRLRVGAGGIQLAFFTPLASAAYLFDRFVEIPEQIAASYVFITVWDNVESKDTRGFLKKETVERMIEAYTDDEKEARIEGKFMHLGGTIFKEFDRSKHVIDVTLPELVKNLSVKSWRVHFAIDPHPVTQTAVLFMAILPDGRRVFIDEIFVNKDTGIIAKVINEILDYCERLGADTNKRIGLIDPSAVIEDKLRGGTSWINDFLKNGVKCIPESKDRDRADDIIRQELRGTVNPNLYFLKGKTNRAVWEFAHYHKSPNNPEKRADEDDHMVENAGRLLLATPNKMFRSSTEEKRRKIIQGLG